MKFRNSLKLSCLIGLLGGSLLLTAVDAERPNIVLIVADDLGYSDLGCYGGEVETPNLDRLAAGGVRFSQFYNCGKCEPTRTALMTGHRNTPEIGFTGERAQSFLAEALRQQGYRTILSGKWHVSGYPLDRGFDKFFGIVEGACDYFTGSGRLRLGREPYEVPDDFYTTDGFTDQAINFLAEASAQDDAQPFFLYLAYTAPHDPLQAPADLIAKYQGRYQSGWESLKEQRYRAVRENGLLPQGTNPTSWPKNLPHWEELSDTQKQMEDLRMATYAAMIDRLDQNVGRLFDWLDANGEWQDTLVIFISDNGASPFTRATKNMERKGILPGGPKSRWAQGTAWAHVSNTPFRLYKRNQHEGGIRAPMILSGPGNGFTPGSIEHAPINILDFMPTLTGIAGSNCPPPGSEGRNLTAHWAQGTMPENYGMMGYLFDHRYIRKGDWKLVSVESGPWELYNLSTDPSETVNRVSERPDLTQALDSEWSTWYRGFAKIPFEPRHRTSKQQRMSDTGNGAIYQPSPMPDGQ